MLRERAKGYAARALAGSCGRVRGSSSREYLVGDDGFPAGLPGSKFGAAQQFPLLRGAAAAFVPERFGRGGGIG